MTILPIFRLNLAPRVPAFAIPLMLPLALAACGGGGGDTASTPTPPPATYQTLEQLTGDRTFQSGGIVTDVPPTGPTNGRVATFGQGVEIRYFAATDTYSLNNGAGLVVDFGPANVTSTDAVNGSVVYQKPNPNGIDTLTIISPRINSVPLSYTLFGSWFNIRNAAIGQGYLMVGGIPTQNADVPRTGTATYATAVGAGGRFNNTVYTFNNTSTATFSANFGSNSVSTSINLIGTQAGPPGAPPGPSVNVGTFNGTGTISATGPGFNGTLSGTAGNGVFAGAFFGPRGAEMGYNFFVSGTNLNAQGSVAGRKN